MGHWQGKYVIGVTGNIATGKSLVRKMLQHVGAYTIDADLLSHQVMAPNAPAFRPVIEWFGKWIVGSDGRIDRTRLGTVAFSHPIALRRLEAITHPYISQAIDTLVKRANHKVVVVEAIKLLEGDLADKVDAIWVVDSDPKVQLQRLVQKRGLPQEEAIKRIRVQNPQDEKIEKATVVIKNNGDVNDTWAQVQSAWDKYIVPFLEPTPEPAPPTPQPGPMAAVQPAMLAPEQTAGVGPTSPTHPTKPRPTVVGQLDVRRPKREDLDALAALLSKARGTKLSESDIIMTFTETSYLVAETNGTMVGSVGFVVENLISQSSEIVILPGVSVEPVLSQLISGMEDASKDLQAEVSFIYLNQQTDGELINLLKGKLGYEETQIENIDFTAWREAVRATQPDGTIILSKKLREERVLTPF
ncbi:MAG: dephospho-CoA kinase [Chloroflexi bacterium]|nr:dephospho-CoA kinase [Chloroflexota bacterium]